MTKKKTEPVAKSTKAKSAPAKKTAQAKSPKKARSKAPTKAEMEKLKKDDTGYAAASKDPVEFLKSRQQAVYTISRNYHLEPEELAQEAYEVLLTCLRDYTPIYEKEEGKFISVQFTTFFGNRLESRAMEMRNRDPEYQARQAMTDGMTIEEKERFRSDPPLLVQHLDQESTMQESLRSEVSEARELSGDDPVFRILRDSFFDRKLSELVAKEKDEKKQAALLHVKVGGIYNFQEIAYHFGVTDSRASQVMNELMDAFYVQRLIDRDLKAVATDFEKLKFNEKRALRLLSEAFSNVDEERAAQIIDIFKGMFKGVEDIYHQAVKRKEKKEKQTKERRRTAPVMTPPAYEEVFTDKENEAYPLKEVGLRPISSLKSIEDMDFRPPEPDETFEEFLESFDVNSPLYPVVVTEKGYVIDGERRLKAARAKGRTDYLCLTREVPEGDDQKLLRVLVNTRLHASSKIEMYYSIQALSAMGMSQQKISDYLGTSRTNVLVYCKVREKAEPRLRALFEDGQIQITNAATCVDLDPEIQNQAVDFIRRHGPAWAKGAKFNKLYQAAVDNKIGALEQKVAPGQVQEAEPVSVSGGASDPGLQRKVEALQKQTETLSTALKDAEVWAAQREGVIKQQREQMNELRAESESLRRELDAAELMKFGNSKAIDQELDHLKAFFALTERLAGAKHSIKQAGTELGRTDVRRKQAIELMNMLEDMEQAVNTFRVELHNHCQALGISKKVG